MIKTIKKHPIVTGIVAVGAVSAVAWNKYSAGPVAWIKPLVDKMRGVTVVDHTTPASPKA
jgi:hypothetical protein